MKRKNFLKRCLSFLLAATLVFETIPEIAFASETELATEVETMTEAAPAKEAETEQPAVISESQETSSPAAEKQDTEPPTTETPEAVPPAVETEPPAVEAESTSSETQETDSIETETPKTDVPESEESDMTRPEDFTEEPKEPESETSSETVPDTETEMEPITEVQTESETKTVTESETEVAEPIVVYGLVGHDTDTLRPYKSFETKDRTSVKDLFPETVCVYTDKNKEETMNIPVTWETGDENNSFYLNIYSLVLPENASWSDSLSKQFDEDKDYIPYVEVSIKRSYNLEDEVAEFMANIESNDFSFIRTLSAIDSDHFIEVLYHVSDDWSQFSDDWHRFFACLTIKNKYAFYTITKEEYLQAVIKLKEDAGRLSSEQLEHDFYELLSTLDVCMLSLGYSSNTSETDKSTATEKAYDYIVSDIPENANVNNFSTYHKYLQKKTSIDIDKVLTFFASVENNINDDDVLVQCFKDNQSYMEETFCIIYEWEAENSTESSTVTETELESETENQDDPESDISFLSASNKGVAVTVRNSDGTSFRYGSTLELFTAFDINEDYTEALKKETSLKQAWKQLLLDVYYKTEKEKAKQKERIMEGVKEFFPYLVRIVDEDGKELSFKNLDVELIITDQALLEHVLSSGTRLDMAIHETDDSIIPEIQPEKQMHISEDSVTLSFETDVLGWCSVIASELPPAEAVCTCGTDCEEEEAFVHDYGCSVFIEKLLEYCDCGCESSDIAKHTLDCLATVFINEVTCTCSEYGEFDGGATPLSYHDPKCKSYVRMVNWLCDCGSDEKEIDLHDVSCAAYKYLYAMNQWITEEETISTYAIGTNMRTLAYGQLGTSYSGCISLADFAATDAHGYNHSFTATVDGTKQIYYAWDNTSFSTSDYIFCSKGAQYNGNYYDIKIFVRAGTSGHKSALISETWKLTNFGWIKANSDENVWGYGNSYAGKITRSDCSGDHSTSHVNKTRTLLRFRFYEPGTSKEVSFNGILRFSDIDSCSNDTGYTDGEMIAVQKGSYEFYCANNNTSLRQIDENGTKYIVSDKATDGSTVNMLYIKFASTAETPLTIIYNSGRYYASDISSGPVRITYKTTKNDTTSTYKTVKVPGYCDYALISKPSTTGYTFSGWYTDSGCKTVASAGYKASGAATYYGKYTPITYTVKYNGNGATGGSTASSSHTYDVAKALTANGFTRTGYTFAGWATSDSGAVSYSNQQSVKNLTSTNGGTVNLYAVWTINKYYIDLNGYLDGVSSGNISGYGTADVYIGGEIKGNDVTDFYQQHEYGQSYEVNDIKATTGHTYNGVYSGSLSGTIGVNKVSISLNFTTNYVHVAYNANGGTLSSSAYSLNNNKFVLDSSGNAWFHDIKYGETKDPYNAATFGLTKTGYTFSGWEVQSSSGVILDQDTAYESIKYTKAGDSTKTTANESGFSCNLLAKWNPNIYTVVYNGNGATGGSTASSSHTYDEAKNLTANGFTRDGYLFSGWATSANGSVVYEDQASVKNLTAANGGTVNLYAVWEVANASYTIQYNGNGATGGSTESSVHYIGIEKNLTANGFTRTGHMFSGWATSANGTVVYADQEPVLNLATTDGETIDLYAVWTVNKYLFDIKGYLDGIHSDTIEGYGTVDIYIDNTLIADDVSDYSEEIPYGSSYEITDIKETTGHTYNGVYSGSISGTIDAADNITSLDFTTNKYKIVFDGNGATSGSMKDSTFTYGVKGNLPKNKYVKDDYNFNKWNTKADGSGTFYSDEEEILNLTSADGEVITLYAQWISACAYIDGVNGNDSNDGKTPETPIKTFAQAYKNLPRGGIIYVVNQVTIKKNMTLGQSSYSDSSETISLGNHTVMVKRYSRPTAYQRLSGFNVASYTGAMILVPSGYTLTLNDVTIDGHRYAKNSGAANEIAPSVSAQSPVICLNSGSLSMNGGTITNNKNTASSSKGGGVYSSSSAAVSITAGTITENYAYYGGGIYSYGKLSISNGTISSNVANYGGGIYSHGTISMAGGIISSNSALTNGGGILNASGSTALITGGTIEDNEASTYGGGILNTGTLSMSNGTITGNSAPNGGGIRNSSNGSVTINGGLITGNSASSNGGAIHNQSSGSLNITGGTIQGNSATLNGSAVYQDGNMYMKKAASISIDNDVYLPVNRYITVDGSLTTEDTVAKITPHKYENGRTVVRTAYPEGKETLASEVYGLFMLTENPDNEDTLLRPGDFVDDSINIKNTDVIISEAYNLSYTSSFNCVTDLPKTQVGYWNEHTIVSDQVPVKPGYKFLLWSIEKDMIDEIGNETGSESESGSETETGTENTIIKEYAPESIILLTEDTILYAVWEINMGIELFIEDEKFYVNKEVTEDDIRRTLQVKVTDLETNERIEDYLGGYDAVLEMVKIKEILDTSNQVFELVDYLYTGIEEIYRVTYELEIIPEYITSPGREDSPSVVGTVLQKVEIIDEYPDLSDQSDPLCDIRFISADYLSSLDSNSKWRTNAELHSKLVASVNKEATDANAVYVIEMTKEQCDSIKAYIFNGKTWDNDLNKDVISAYGGVLSKRP